MERHTLHFVLCGLFCLCVCQLLPDRGQLPPGAETGQHKESQGKAGQQTEGQGHGVNCGRPISQEAAPVPLETGI